MIKTVIKSEKGMVMVFDENGEQIPEYQGQYDEMKEKVLTDAPPDAVFYHDLKAIPREEW